VNTVRKILPHLGGGRSLDPFDERPPSPGKAGETQVFEPASSRVFVRFKDAANGLQGSTGVAIERPSSGRPADFRG